MAEPVGIKLRWLDHGRGLPLPAPQTAGAAGVDLHAALLPDEPVVLAPGARALIPCGFVLALPQGFEAQIRPRSGLAANFGVTVLNSPGTLDSDYRGEVKVLLVNLSGQLFVVRRGERIAQMVVAPVAAVKFSLAEELDDTERGTNGFGSTGSR